MSDLTKVNPSAIGSGSGGDTTLGVTSSLIFSFFLRISLSVMSSAVERKMKNERRYKAAIQGFAGDCGSGNGSGSEEAIGPVSLPNSDSLDSQNV